MSSIANEIREYLKVRKHAPPAPSLTEARSGYEQMATQFKLFPGTTTEKITIGQLNAEWVIAPNAKDRVILYLHGGCYVLGSSNTHRALVSRIATSIQAKILFLEYRLAPENPFPAAVEDAVIAYRWLLDQGFKSHQIGLVGDSAGGGLSIATMVSLRDQGHALPAGAALISPWTDLAGTGDSFYGLAEIDPWLIPEEMNEMAALYLAKADAKDPLASPVYADLMGLPPLLIQVGADEILLDDATRLAKNAEAKGVHTILEIWPEMWHAWHIFAEQLPEAEQAIDKIGEFFDKVVYNN